MTDERIPYLTVGERAELHGITFSEELELERTQPWVRHWSARFAAGAERLRTWLAGGRPAADRAALCVVGDRTIVDAVRAVVAKLPEPVAHFVVGNAVIFCAGVDSIAWTGQSMPVLPHEAARPIVITTTDHGACAHEVGHLWQLRGLPANARLTAEKLARLEDAGRAIAAEEGKVDEKLDQMMLIERAADAAASAWLGYRVDSTSGLLGEARRRRELIAIQRAAEPDEEE